MAIVQALTSFWVIGDETRLVYPGELFDSTDPIVTSRPGKFSDPVGEASAGGGEHPNLAVHDTLGLATDAELAAHAATAHGGDAGPHTHDYAASVHTHDTSHSHTAVDVGAAETAHTHDTTHSHDLTAYATDADLAAHAATSHGGGSGEGVPAGVIAMWGGLVANIPTGWVLCDGANGTPNLTDRFIKGGTPGTTGGTSSHTHAAHTQGRKGGTTNPMDIVNTATHDTVNHEPPYYTLAFIQKT